MDTLIQALIGIGREWAEGRWAQLRQGLLQALEREQRRLFDALLLLGLGLIFSLLGLLGLLTLLWWCTPPPWRPLVMALVLIGLGAAGVLLLRAARQRLSAG